MKVVFTDLDGTLFNNETRISNYTKERMTYLKSQGFIFVVVSGRCFSSLKKPLKDDLDLFAFFITNNGANIYDKEGRELANVKFSSSKIKSLYLKVKDDVRGFNYYLDDIGYSLKEDSKNKLSSKKILVSLDDVNYDANKVLLIANNDKLKAHEADIKALDLNYVYSYDGYMDIINSTVSKANGIKLILEKLKNVEEVFIFGDYDNDKEMLSLDYTTVCMKNGIEELKSVSKYVSEFTNDEDGVVRFIEGR